MDTYLQALLIKLLLQRDIWLHSSGSSNSGNSTRENLQQRVNNQSTRMHSNECIPPGTDRNNTDISYKNLPVGAYRPLMTVCLCPGGWGSATHGVCPVDRQTPVKT